MQEITINESNEILLTDKFYLSKNKYLILNYADGVRIAKRILCNKLTKAGTTTDIYYPKYKINFIYPVYHTADYLTYMVVKNLDGKCIIKEFSLMDQAKRFMEV